MQENARLNSIIANYRMHMNSKHIPVEYIQLEVEHNTTGNYTNL